jgi:hypothetical protein
MPGNLHVRFLGEDEPAMVHPYPTLSPTIPQKATDFYGASGGAQPTRGVPAGCLRWAYPNYLHTLSNLL